MSKVSFCHLHLRALIDAEEEVKMASLATKGYDQGFWHQMQTGRVQVEYRSLPLWGQPFPMPTG